jgi:hypothetical protein
MPEMQQEIYYHPQHQRARFWEGEMPKMRWEKTGTTYHRFPGKDLEEELIMLKNCKCERFYVCLCLVILNLFQNLVMRAPETSSG